MLKKLLKYDLKWSFKPLIIFYILSIFFAVVTRILGNFDNSFIFIIIDKICFGITISMIINILINNFMRVWARTIRNLYKDEAYLTHTLPVTKRTIFLSKVLTAVITTLVSFIVIVACLAICLLSKENLQILKTFMEQTAVFLNSSVSSVIIVMAITLFFEILFMIMAGILGIIIGYRSNNLKTLKSIIYGFLLYMLASTISIGILYIAGLFNSEIMKLFTSVDIISASALKETLYVGIAIYIIYDIIYYLIGKKVLNKGVNVD